MKKVLCIVYYFPPMGASGVQRPLKFMKYLREYGWEPVVLAPEAGAYHTFDPSLQQELQSLDLSVYRVKAQTPFHRLSGVVKLLSRLPEKMKIWIRKISYGLMLPDNKKGWIKPALQKAKEVFNDHNIDVIYSTAPPYSNHIIATRLKSQYGKPVVMDFRDDWLESQLIEYPTRWHKRKMANMERYYVSQTDAVTVLDKENQSRISERIPGDDIHYTVIPHGYDPEDFERNLDSSLQYDPQKLNLLYSGIFVYNNQPDPFLEAVHRCIKKQPSMKSRLKLHFQGELEHRHEKLIKKLNLNSIIAYYGYLPHKESVANLKKADALWVISDYGREHRQVTSGKLFEYLGSRKPILGLVYPGEETRILEEYKASYICPPDDVEQISRQFINLYEDWLHNSLPEPEPSVIKSYNRRRLTGKLAKLFQNVSQDS